MESRIRQLEGGEITKISATAKQSAEDKGTGSKEKITITNDQNRLTPEDFEKMINDAEKFDEVESYAYSLKNQLSDKEKLGGKLSDEETAKIEEVRTLFLSLEVPLDS